MDTDVVKLYPFSEPKQPLMFRQVVYADLKFICLSYVCCCWFNTGLCDPKQPGYPLWIANVLTTFCLRAFSRLSDNCVLANQIVHGFFQRFSSTICTKRYSCLVWCLRLKNNSNSRTHAGLILFMLYSLIDIRWHRYPVIIRFLCPACDIFRGVEPNWSPHTFIYTGACLHNVILTEKLLSFVLVYMLMLSKRHCEATFAPLCHLWRCGFFFVIVFYSLLVSLKRCWALLGCLLGNFEIKMATWSVFLTVLGVFVYENAHSCRFRAGVFYVLEWLWVLEVSFQAFFFCPPELSNIQCVQLVCFCPADVFVCFTSAWRGELWSEGGGGGEVLLFIALGWTAVGVTSQWPDPAGLFIRAPTWLHIWI